MASPILISQNDFGIAIEVSLIDKDKKPIIIGSDDVDMFIVNPLGVKLPVKEIPILDNNNGLCQLSLTAEHTKIPGNYAVYVQISNVGYEVNTVLAFYYFVVPKHGGAS